MTLPASEIEASKTSELNLSDLKQLQPRTKKHQRVELTTSSYTKNLQRTTELQYREHYNRGKTTRETAKQHRGSSSTQQKQQYSTRRGI